MSRLLGPSPTTTLLGVATAVLVVLAAAHPA